MGNEKQISRELIEQSKAEFLPKEFHDPDAHAEMYSLEEEYAKTQQNRSLRLYVSIFIFFSAVVISSIIWVVMLQKQGEQLKVDISDFKDVKALDSINQVKNLEIKLSELKFELKGLIDKRADEVSRLNREYRSQKEALLAVDSADITEKSIDTVDDADDEFGDSTGGSEEDGVADGKTVSVDDTGKDISAASSRFKRKTSSIRSSYDGKIKRKESEIAKLEEQLTVLKASMGKDFDSAGVVLGEKDELFNLQINKMRRHYEDKIADLNRKHESELDELLIRYNPSFKESSLRTIVARRIRHAAIPGKLLAAIEVDLNREKVATNYDIELVRKGVSGELALLGRLKRVPYTNSVPRSLLHIESFVKSSIQVYDKIVKGLVTNVRRKNAMLSAFNYAFVSKVKRDGENGFILDARNSRNIILYIDDTYEIRDGDTGFVFRTDDTLIATITIRKGAGLHYGTIIKTTTGARIRSFDKLMLKVVREKE